MNLDPYASWADLYDVMIDWQSRLRGELPVLQKSFRDIQARKILDIACGTGRHSWALSDLGYEVVGADASEEMVRRAKDCPIQQSHQGSPPQFQVWNMKNAPPESLQSEKPFDGIICFGNSFAHLPRTVAVQALIYFSQLLRPGGGLLFQMKNLFRRRKDNDIHLPLVRHTTADGQSALFIRFYEFFPERKDEVIFHLITSVGEELGEKQIVTPPRRVHHEPAFMQLWNPQDLALELQRAGFEAIKFEPVGGQQKDFDPFQTEDFYLHARRTPNRER